MRSQRLGFIGQLDSFRFLAVLLVIISHWAPDSVLNKLPNGYLGVTFFFVLSGFLISSNLLLARESVKSKKTSNRKALVSFYIRRSLRIFPLYYLVLFLLWIFKREVFEGNILWYLCYASNFLFFFHQVWQHMLSHFWSLAVEEQFYIIWPFLLLFTQNKKLLSLLIATVVLSMGYKLCMNLFFSNVLYSQLLPIAAFDAFGLGAILAYQHILGRSFRLMKIKNLLWVIPVLVLSLGFYIYGYTKPLSFIFPYAAILIIHQSITGFTGLAGRFLNNQTIMFLGKISYGLYIYHNFIPWLVRCFRGTEKTYVLNVKPFLSDWHPSSLSLMLMQFFLLVGIASASWYGFERPLNNLKRYF